MEKETLLIPNISCGHCVMAIKDELTEMAGVKAVQGDAQGKSITIQWEAPADLEQIKAKLAQINYPTA